LVHQESRLMPKYQIKSPDGHTYEINAPEGASRDDVVAYAKKQFAQTTQHTPDQPAAPATNVPSYRQPGSVLSTIGRPVGKAVADIESMAVDPAMVVQNKIMGTNYEMPSQTTRKALDKALPPPSDALSQGAETASSMLLGGAVGPSGELRGGAQLAEFGREEALRAAHRAGYKIAPSEVGDAPIGQALQSAAGKPRLERELRASNQEVHNRLSKLALDLHPDHPPLDTQVIEEIRDEAGRAYEALRQLPGRVRTDEPLLTEIANSGQDFSKLDRAFPREPGIAQEEIDRSLIEREKGRWLQQDFSPGEAVDAMRQLRNDAARLLKTGKGADWALGMVKRQIAEAFAGRLGRYAAEQNQHGLVDALRAARERIAKTHIVEDALNETTGDVDASHIARAYHAGAHLTDELETIARTAQAFKRSAGKADYGSEGPFSVVDAMLGAMGAAHNPVLLSAVLLRPATRQALKSGIYQSSLVPSATREATRGLSKSGMTAVGAGELESELENASNE
jgi:curved DNA-binding protein CbpA